MNKLKRFLLLGIAASLLMTDITCAYGASQNAGQSLSLMIVSRKTLSGKVGDFTTVNGQITNSGQQPLNDITTYISLVDELNKMPVDLEDWSAEKGLFIGTIDFGQTLPLNWEIHFVKAGSYSLVIIAEIAGQEFPLVSSIVHFSVAPKFNLNPGKVLPVALGTPVILIFLMLLVNYKRNLSKN